MANSDTGGLGQRRPVPPLEKAVRGRFFGQKTCRGRFSRLLRLSQIMNVTVAVQPEFSQRAKPALVRPVIVRIHQER